ncbi:MAG TPA: IS5 family transposase [Novosphingobium sp.]|nr:IS5 family transposase [Novosphingobium sp.]
MCRPKYGNWNTIYRRFRRWSEAGVWKAGRSRWPRSWLTVVTTASTVPRFAPCLGGGRKRGGCRRALGRSRGGFTSKLHCLADARGRPIAFHPTHGEAADCTAYAKLIDLPERAPRVLLADKGYDTNAIRADLVHREIQAVIPAKSNRREKIDHDRVLYRQRNGIERAFGRLKINRAIATRYDQMPSSFLGMVYLATIRFWLKFVHAA